MPYNGQHNWQHPDWPQFKYELSAETQAILYQYARESSSLQSALSHFSEAYQQEALIELMVGESLSTAAIEGEFYSRLDVRSSIRNQFGLTDHPEPVHDKRAQGSSRLLFLARQHLEEDLTAETLCQWQDGLIVDPYQRQRIDRGKWRSEAVQIVSGAVGRQIVHFEAPPAARVPQEMARFLEWFNASRSLPAPLRAAIAHIYFESIHPFSDGNGRIGRALSERVLSQELGVAVLLSLSTQIMKNKKSYYVQLAGASCYSLDVTDWASYFCRLILEAQLDAKELIQFILKKAKFWDKYAQTLSPRQIKVIQRVFEAGKEGFEGGLSAKKYGIIADCSKATATRDLADLVKLGCLYQLEGSGRNTRYALIL
jgi:Fic family protein